jgi:hypothetical protein
MSQDVKGLFLGVRFVSSGVIVRLQLEDDLLIQEGCSVRAQEERYKIVTVMAVL